MTDFSDADTLEPAWLRTLLSGVTRVGDVLEESCPPLDVAADAARLRASAEARGLIAPALARDELTELQHLGDTLEESCPPLDVAADAARLRASAEARGLIEPVPDEPQDPTELQYLSDNLSSATSGTHPYCLQCAAPVEQHRRFCAQCGQRLSNRASAVDEAMAEVLRRWRQIDNLRAYERTAVLRYLAKTRVRDGDRLRRTIAGGQVTPEGTDDAGLTVWEDEQWVTQLLDALPLVQRYVMMGLYRGMTTAEIADLLGKTPEAVRHTLRRARAVLREELARERNEGSRSPGTTREAPR
jgi:DNA-directed RNA polymerase specialized sigma24 family protein